jgi:uncharacterized membrane protein YedE/YeeE
MSFWDIIWFIIVAYAFIAYLTILFNIIADLFRDRESSGWAKAGWVVVLLVIPFLGALIYVIARGRGMTERHAAAYEDARAAQDDYIRSVASPSSASDEIASAKALLDSGTITAPEYENLKAKALA